jgi:conjugative relaxase-like TrwC/TraI family protein
MSLSKETVLWRLSAGTELESSNGQLFRKRAPVQVDGIWNLAKDLGLEEGKAITSKQLKDLSENKHAITGEKLTREAKGRKPFCDITISIPKTWSIQDNIAGDKRVRGYHRQAKEKVKAEFYQIVGRQAHNGVEHLEFTGKLAGVEYEHDTNRSQEVQTHTHLILWNATRSENGKLYAIDYREFMDQSPYLG